MKLRTVSFSSIKFKITSVKQLPLVSITITLFLNSSVVAVSSVFYLLLACYTNKLYKVHRETQKLGGLGFDICNPW